MASRYRQREIEESDTFKFVKNLPLEQKISFYQKEARKANKRIRNLEKAGIKSIPYKELARETDKPRFYTGKRITSKDIDRRLKDVLIFTEAKTSSVSGYKKEFKKRIATLKRNQPEWFYDENGKRRPISDEELMQLFEAGAFSSERFGDSSQTIMEGLSLISKKGDSQKVIDAFTNSENKTLFQAVEQTGLGRF